MVDVHSVFSVILDTDGNANTSDDRTVLRSWTNSQLEEMGFAFDEYEDTDDIAEDEITAEEAVSIEESEIENADA